MKYRLVIFDFDGTLADSFPFFISTFNHLADKHSFRRVQPEEIEAMRHYSPLELMKHVGMPAWKLPLVAHSFIALMKDNQAAVPLFRDVASTLAYLTERQIALGVVSSNSRENVTQVLGAHCRHIGHFECGVSIFGKASRLRRVLRNIGAPANEAIYIGDQATDYEAAKAAGMAFGAVTWGYGAIEALRKRMPEEDISSVADIRRIAGNTSCVDKRRKDGFI
ncbi:MAG: haloacid dehalogenase [Burkholderia sp.]|nr:haloacid dehalogenase [Burkholderia sp.]